MEGEPLRAHPNFPQWIDFINLGVKDVWLLRKRLSPGTWSGGMDPRTRKDMDLPQLWRKPSARVLAGPLLP
eukprot:8908701-Heterocapsa_arctica.AAC.1